MREVEPLPQEPSRVEPVPLLDCAQACQDLERQLQLRRDKIRAQRPDLPAPSDKTIRKHLDRVGVLYRAMHPAADRWCCGDLEWARDTDGVLEFIRTHTSKWKAESSRNAIRTALAAVLRNLKGFEAEATVYSKQCTQIYADVIKLQAGDNVLPAPRQANYVEWEALLPAVLTLPRGSKELALAAVYTFVPPRRIEDYRLMRLWAVAPGRCKRRALRADRGLNYLLVAGGRPEAFVFNEYKTKGSFGQQVLPLSEGLAAVIGEYVREHAVAHGAPLFPASAGRPHSDHSSFSKAVSAVFQACTGKRVSVNLLRRAFISFALSQQLSVNERKDLAERMAHSLGTQMTYEVIKREQQPGPE
jgi:hypothetical protein